MLGDLLQDDRRTADEGSGSGAQRWRLLDVLDRDGPDESDPGAGRHDERGELEGQAEMKRPDHGCDHRRDSDETERQRRGEQFGDTEYCCHDQPHDPGLHGRSAE